MKFAWMAVLAAAVFTTSCNSVDLTPTTAKPSAGTPPVAGAQNMTEVRAPASAPAVKLAAGAVPVPKPKEGADPNFWVFLAFGQSNMEGYSPVTFEAQDKQVDKRFQMLAAVDFNNMGRKAGNWYDAIPPLCRQSTGLCPADYFGRTMVANTPSNIKIGVLNVAVAGCKIEMFDKDTFKTYISSQAGWMQNISREYGNNPYQKLIDMGKVAQKTGVIRGILLHQGESNSGDRQWPAKVKKIYEDMLKDLDLQAESTPLIAGQPVGESQIITSLPNTIPTAKVVSSRGCEARQDRLHFSFAGYRELGKRYAEAMLPLMGVEVKK